MSSVGIFLNPKIRKEIQTLNERLTDLDNSIPSLDMKLDELTKKNQHQPDIDTYKKKDQKSEERTKLGAERTKKDQDVSAHKGSIEKQRKQILGRAKSLGKQVEKIEKKIAKGMTAKLRLAVYKQIHFQIPDTATKSEAYWVQLPKVEDGKVTYSPEAIYNRAELNKLIKRQRDIIGDVFGGWLRRLFGKNGSELDLLELKYAEQKAAVAVMERTLRRKVDLDEDAKQLLADVSNAYEDAKVSPTMRIRSWLAGELLRHERTTRIEGLNEDFIESKINKETVEFLGPDGIKQIKKWSGFPVLTPSGIIKWGRTVIGASIVFAAVGTSQSWLTTTFKSEVLEQAQNVKEFTLTQGSNFYYVLWGQKQKVEDILTHEGGKDYKPDVVFFNYLKTEYANVFDYFGKETVPPNLHNRFRQMVELQVHYRGVKAQLTAEQLALEREREAAAKEAQMKKSTYDRLHDSYVAEEVPLANIGRIGHKETLLTNVLEHVESLQETSLDLGKMTSVLKIVKKDNYATAIVSLELPETLQSNLLGIYFYHFKLRTFRQKGHNSVREIDDHLDELVATRVTERFLSEAFNTVP